MCKFSKTTVLFILAMLVFLGMLRLGVWQLDRAAQKQAIVDRHIVAQQRVPVELNQRHSIDVDDRFRQARVTGEYLHQHTVFVDNQVLNQQVGYQVFTPLRLADHNTVILVARGWLAKRADKNPIVDSDPGELTLSGRLNLSPSRPPLWNDDYPVFSGAIWQYLPIDQLAQEKNLPILPLVLELAPGTQQTKLKRQWQQPDDTWVDRHRAYALQWFSMAVVFLLLCAMVAIRRK